MLVSTEWSAKNLKFSFLHLGWIRYKVRKKNGLGASRALFCDELPSWLRLLGYRFRAIGGPGCKKVSLCHL